MKAKDVVTQNKILYIKLGHGGEWEQDCIEAVNTIRLGFREADHALCMEGRWDEVARYFREVEKRTPGKATEITNQIRAFYEEPESTTWCTFYAGHLWWCKANAEVTLSSDRTKTRRVIGKWNSQDAKGNPIALDTLSGKLLQTRGFRGTICQPSAAEYLRRRLLGEKMPEVTRALQARKALVETIIPVIQNLAPQDFELLIDLIFRQGGWQRAGIVGGTEKDIDLYLYSPVTQERIAIQIKSRSSIVEFRNYMERFGAMPDFDKFFYVVHSGGEELQSIADEYDRVSLIAGRELGDLVVRSGLVDWAIDKAG